MTDTEKELEFHIEMQTRRFCRGRPRPGGGTRKSHATNGRPQGRRQTHRDHHHDPHTHGAPALAADHAAGRALRRARSLTDAALTATALLTLAIGIGATTAIFSVVNAVLLRDLPYPNAGRTLVFYNSYPKTDLVQAATAPEAFGDVRSQAQAFEQFTAIRPGVMLGVAVLAALGPARRATRVDPVEALR